VTGQTAPHRLHTPPAPTAPVPHATSELDPGPADGRLAYSVAEAARLTGLSRDLLYDQMRSGNLHYIKIGRRRLITRQHLQHFLGITPEASTP
jgi:excisionase family DNA binding protein